MKTTNNLNNLEKFIKTIELIERKIGERFEYNGTTLEVEVEEDDEKDVCIGCYFSDMKTCNKRRMGWCCTME